MLRRGVGPCWAPADAGHSGPDKSPASDPFSGLSETAEGPEVSARVLADLLGVTTQALTPHRHAGRLVRMGRGYALRASVRGYCAALRGMASGRGGEAALDLAAERARLAKEQADGQAMKNETLRGNLLARADVDAAMIAAFARVRARLLAIPSKLAPQVVTVATAPEAAVIIRSAVNEALRELSETRPDDLTGAEE